ncbi:32929_t:CDS:2, partial [Racocetra persica]
TKIMKIHCFVFAFLPLFLSTTSIVFCDKSAQQYFDEGNEFFADQKYDEAVKSFVAAINQNPNDYLYYFKRALTYLALERRSLSEAKADLKQYLQKNEQDIEGQKLLVSVNSAETHINTAEDAIKSESHDACIENIFKAIKISPHSPRLRLTRAQCHLAKGEVEEGVRDLS